MKGILEMSWIGLVDWGCGWACGWEVWRWAVEDELWLLVLPSGVLVFDRSPGIFDIDPMDWYHLIGCWAVISCYRILGLGQKQTAVGLVRGLGPFCERLVRGSRDESSPNWGHE